MASESNGQQTRAPVTNGHAPVPFSDDRSPRGPAESVGLVHDWLPVYAGAESVLEQTISVFPESRVYSLLDFIDENERGFLQGVPVETSFLQRLPFAERMYRYYLALPPLAIEQFDLRDYDIVISSNHAVAKGVLTRPDQLHISYVHRPLRYAWDLYHESMSEMGGIRGMLARLILQYMRFYDVTTASRVDAFVANSQHVARRIWKTYRRRAKVIYPPVDVNRFTRTTEKEDYNLAMSRLVPYKRMDLIVQTLTEMPNRELYVIGNGPEFDRLDALAGPNVTLLGHQPNEAVNHYMENARAFVFAAEEDFGIAPVEAQACGTPVIAYGRGGATETVRPGVTGVFFPRQTPTDVERAVRKFERIESTLVPGEIRRHAEQFAIPVFRQAVSEYVSAAYRDFQQKSMMDEQVPVSTPK